MLDTAIKIIALVSTLIVIPLFGWVWHTNVQLERISIKVENLEKDVEIMKPNTLTVALLKQDIDHIRSDLNEIKTILKSGK